jgi:hypothetical protein
LLQREVIKLVIAQQHWSVDAEERNPPCSDVLENIGTFCRALLFRLPEMICYELGAIA